MRTVAAYLRIVEGKEAEAEAAIRKMAKGVEENEKGAHAYIFHRNEKDPLQVLVFEIYADADAFKQHMGSDYFAEFQKSFGPGGCFDPAQVKIERYERIAGFTR